MLSSATRTKRFRPWRAGARHPFPGYDDCLTCRDGYQPGGNFWVHSRDGRVIGYSCYDCFSEISRNGRRTAPTMETLTIEIERELGSCNSHFMAREPYSALVADLLRGDLEWPANLWPSVRLIREVTEYNTPEQAARRRDCAAEEQERCRRNALSEAERVAETAAATERATALLRRFLAPEQRAAYERGEQISVQGRRYLWRIDAVRSLWLWRGDCWQYACVTIVDGLPAADRILALLLWIRGAEAGLLRVATITATSRRLPLAGLPAWFWSCWQRRYAGPSF